MNRKIQLAAFLLFCAAIITLAIRAGKAHEHCGECLPDDDNRVVQLK